MKRAWPYLFAGSLCLLCVIPCLGLNILVEVPLRLALGWIHFLVKVVPEIRIDWPNVAFPVAMFVAFVLGLHWFLRWLYRASQVARSEPTVNLEVSDVPAPATTWSCRWTAAGSLLVLLMFVSGISMVGISHQVVWLFASDEPFTDSLGVGAARQSASKTNLKVQVRAFESHGKDFEDKLPGGAMSDGRGQLLHGWQTAILPYLDHQQLFAAIDQQRPWNVAPNDEIMRTRLWMYQIPELRGRHQKRNSDGFALSHYSGNSHVLGRDKVWKFEDVTDGTANTILTGEAAGDFRPWGSPANWRDPALGIGKSSAGFGGPWRNGVTQFSMCDGSVISLSKDTDPRVLRALATPRGGEDATLP